MKKPGFNEGPRSGLVKDAMNRAVRLERGETVGRALQRLEQENVHLGVVNSAKGEPFGIVTRKQLSKANENKEIRTLVRSRNAAHIVHVKPHDKLDNVVEIWAGDFATNRKIRGIVIQEHGTVLGVLPRKNIERHAVSMGLARGGESVGAAGYVSSSVGRLAGDPLSNALYKCVDCPGAPLCHSNNPPEEQRVGYYDRKKPPTCSQGRRMRRV